MVHEDFRKDKIKRAWIEIDGGGWVGPSRSLYKTPWMKNSIEETLKFLRSIKMKKVLEIGCFNAHHLKIFAEEFPDVEFLGIDISPTFIKMAEANSNGLKNVSFKIMDAEEMTFNKEFDVVICGDIMCAYPQDGARSIFNAMTRATKKYLILQREFDADFASPQSYHFMENYWCLSIHNFDLWFEENGFSLSKINLGETDPTRGRLNAMLIGEIDGNC